MKKTLTMLILALTLCFGLAIAVNAAEVVDSGTCGGEGDGSNLTWTLDSDGTLTISGTGAMRNFFRMDLLVDYAFAPWANVRSQIKNVIISDGVVFIGNNSFYGDYSNLESVSIGSDVVEIGHSAFQGSKIITVTIPSNVEFIGDLAFADCEQLSEFIVSESNNSFSTIDGVLFSKDYSTLVAYPSGRTAEHYTIPDSVTNIGRWAFANQQHPCNLKSVTMPDSVISVDDGAFFNCRMLEEVDFSSNLETIGDDAFAYCTSLPSEFHIPDSVKTIGDWVFYNCNMTNMVIPNSVESIGAGAFASRSMEEFIVEETNAAYSAIDGILYSKDLKTIVSYPAAKEGVPCVLPDEISVATIYSGINGNIELSDDGSTKIIMFNTYEIPDGVTTIYDGAFYGCTLYLVIIPNSVTSIGDSAFLGSSLNSITIPDGVISIGNQAFRNCFGLELIKIGDSVETIGNYAFQKDELAFARLRSVYIGKNVKSIGDCAFQSNMNLQEVTLPDGITTIGNGAFSNCGITDVYYGGDEVQWNAITIGENNAPLLDATIHYGSSNGGGTSTELIAGFTDVFSTDYYADAVAWAVNNGITNGMDDGIFAPDFILTRAQALTFLWRVKGQPAPTSRTNQFIDVVEASWYSAAVSWAVEQGITNGIAENVFAPDDPVTRGQMITFLWRAEGKPDATGSTIWFADAENWAKKNNLLSGTAVEYTTDDPCPRADVVYYLWKELA